MSCYFRHLKGLFLEAGIEVTSANKKQIDQAFHKAVDVTYKNCPATWKEIKRRINSDSKQRDEFILQLRAAVQDVGKP
jgi:hypothetical protein